MLNSFERSLLISRNNKLDGVVELFSNFFYYHYGPAFYDTYNEIFKSEIYAFNSKAENPLIIDCGANMGLSVLYFSKKHPNSKIIAFEPDESVITYLEKNIKSQNIKNVELIKKAVWISETNLPFYTDNGLGGRVGMKYKNQIATKVKTIRLKDLLNRNVSFLKLDIEGSEYLVLKDCESELSNVENIFIEYHSIYNEEQHLDDILNILKRNGYRYHLKQSFSRQKPFIDKKNVCEQFDMAINIFGYKEINN
jgi:FkbM family methyltransferase